MAIVLSRNGAILALKALTANTAQTENFQLRLYQNNITPADTDTAATYTVATFTGYAAIALLAASWTFVAASPSSMSYAQQSFTSSAAQAAQSIYGYYVVRATTGDLVYAERFANGPYTISNNGDAIQITPAFTLG